MKTAYQTLSQFLANPFGAGKSSSEKISEYERKYKDFLNTNKIYLEGYCKMEDSYYMHIRVPSESNKDGKMEYDVVIRFFTDKMMIKAERTLQNYYVQFFSNSPGFMYHYAVLYKQKGFLIEQLYDKMDPEFFDKLPEKTNPDMKLSFDKSIFFACKYLSEHTFRYLNKLGVIANKLKKPDKFFSDISDFKTVKVSTELLSIEKKMNRALEQQSSTGRHGNDNKKKTMQVKSTTMKDHPKSITVKVKKTGSGRVSKITAKKSTYKKQG